MHRFLRRGLLLVVSSTMFGNLAVAGCRASGDVTEFVEPLDSGVDSSKVPSEPTTDAASKPSDKVDASASDASTGTTTGDAGSDAGSDAGAGKDASADGGADAGPSYLLPGELCAAPGKIFKRPCGKCGSEEAICQASPDAGTLADGGVGGILSAYGICTNDVGLCLPGTTQPCGYCGTRTCTSVCAWSACTGEGSCAPGSVGLSSTSCTQPNSFIERTCDSACAWGPYGTTCSPPELTVPSNVGDVTAKQWNLSTSFKMKRIGSGNAGCPQTYLASTPLPAVATVVTNTTGKTAVVQVYNSGSKPLDTALTIYKGSTIPVSDDDFKACVDTADSCVALSDLCANAANGGGVYDWAGIDNITIPAGESIVVQTTGYTAGVTGSFTLNVKTKSFK